MKRRVRRVRRVSRRNPRFNVSWWALYKAAIAGICGVSEHGMDLDSAAHIGARAAQIADACWNIWLGRQEESEDFKTTREKPPIVQ